VSGRELSLRELGLWNLFEGVGRSNIISKARGDLGVKALPSSRCFSIMSECLLCVFWGGEGGGGGGGGGDVNGGKTGIIDRMAPSEWQGTCLGENWGCGVCLRGLVCRPSSAGLWVTWGCLAGGASAS
jgi:hypothetical protein